MVARVRTVAFRGIEVLEIDVQVQIAGGVASFTLVGLPDKAVTESRERVRSALHALGLALPPKRITVNLAPADVLKEGSHFDLPIALGLLVAMGVLAGDAIDDCSAMGELALDGTLLSVNGILPAAVDALRSGRKLICPQACAAEAALAGGEGAILASGSLLALLNHLRGRQLLPPVIAQATRDSDGLRAPDLREIKGQETAKRALEVVAAGGHNLLMIGPPGAGKSMLAARLSGLLPPMSSGEAIEVSIIHSLAGQLRGRLTHQRPFREPHHSASLPALIGGGLRSRPGEVSLAHHGVLFLDEFPEFSRKSLESLRQPLESGCVSVARANHHITYPARFQLVAAMNPCRCGYLSDPGRACTRAPRCAQDYQSKISGPLLDRIDCHIEVNATSSEDLRLPMPDEGSSESAERVRQARDIQRQRYRYHSSLPAGAPTVNAQADGALLEQVATLGHKAHEMLLSAVERWGLSARSYYRLMRVSRTIADLEQSEVTSRFHVAEALSYRNGATPYSWAT